MRTPSSLDAPEPLLCLEAAVCFQAPGIIIISEPMSRRPQKPDDFLFSVHREPSKSPNFLERRVAEQVAVELLVASSLLLRALGLSFLPWAVGLQTGID